VHQFALVRRQLKRTAVAMALGHVAPQFSYRFHYNFIFNGRFNPTKAIMGTSLKFHDYRRSADVRLLLISAEAGNEPHQSE
jgi:hypothetical protein